MRETRTEEKKERDCSAKNSSEEQGRVAESHPLKRESKRANENTNFIVILQRLGTVLSQEMLLTV
jgi:hypothetical protein